MKLVQDLVRKRKLFQILALTLLILDLVTFLTMEALDMAFTMETESYNQKICLFILKVK